jgi:hypothetical protein
VAAFIDEVFDPYYGAASKKPLDYAFGQIFNAPAYYPHQKLEVWRPKHLDAKLGLASDFSITTAGDAFRRSQPYSVPPLKTNEEFITLKAKPRPVILIQPNSKFQPDFVDRVRRLEYRQFLFLPKGGPILVDSIARLDEIQSVAESQLLPTGYSLADDVSEILRSQVSFFFTGLSGGEFAGWAALLKA